MLHPPQIIFPAGEGSLRGLATGKRDTVIPHEPHDPRTKVDLTEGLLRERHPSERRRPLAQVGFHE